MAQKEDLNIISIEINNMEIKKAIMKTGNEYELLWDIDLIYKSYLKMIDIKKGWVELKRESISEMYSLGKLKGRALHPKIKKLIWDYYGKDVFLE